MPHLIRLADPCTDNAALCRLSALCPQGQRLGFYHARDDHWERCRLFDDPQVVVAEVRGEIVGAGTFAWKQVEVAGARQRVTYFFDRLVHPAFRRQGIGRVMLARQLELAGETLLCYGLVLEDNFASRALLESQGFVAHPRRLLYYAILTRGMLSRARQFSRRSTLLQGRERMAPAASTVDHVFAKTHEFVESSAAAGEGLFVTGDGQARAAAVLYRHGAKVVVHAPWYYELLGRVLPFVPRIGRPIRIWALSHVWSEDENALSELMRGVAAAGREEGVAAILLPLYANDARIPALRRFTVNRWGIAPTPVCLYLRGELASALLQSDRPLLASGRDG